ARRAAPRVLVFAHPFDRAHTRWATTPGLPPARAVSRSFPCSSRPRPVVVSPDSDVPEAWFAGWDHSAVYQPDAEDRIRSLDGEAESRRDVRGAVGLAANAV